MQVINGRVPTTSLPHRRGCQDRPHRTSSHRPHNGHHRHRQLPHRRSLRKSRTHVMVYRLGRLGSVQLHIMPAAACLSRTRPGLPDVIGPGPLASRM